jgi:hypothetical protein
MGKKVAVVLFSVGLLGIAACTTTRTGVPPIEFSKIVDAPEMIKDDLFVKTNLWAVGHFNKADSVIEYSDKEAGIISGKYVGERKPVNGGLSGFVSIRSIFTISVKDEKVKLDLKPVEFIIYGERGQPTTSSYVYASIEEAEVIADYNAILESLKQSLTVSSSW